jgi:uncharacterized protein with HEPN domain
MPMPKVDDRIVWEVIERKLPALHNQATILLDEVPEPNS